MGAWLEFLQVALALGAGWVCWVLIRFGSPPRTSSDKALDGDGRGNL